jgi:deoxyribonuclease-1-like protein
MRNTASLPAIIAVVTSLAAYAGCEPENRLQNRIDSSGYNQPTFNQPVSTPTGYDQAGYTAGYTSGYSQQQAGAQPSYGQQTFGQYPPPQPQQYSQQTAGQPTYGQAYGQPQPSQSIPQNGITSSNLTPQAQFTSTQPTSLPTSQPTSLASTANTASQLMPQRRAETILVGSFNIQTFGQSKMSDQWVMGRLAEVIRMFDVVGIQEIRSTDQTILDVLMTYINSTGGSYQYVMGPRLGRTVSKEQYAYIYDSNRISTGPNATYTLNDDIDALHREPLVGRFVVRSNLTNRPWTFSLVNLHTDPDVAVQEVNSMGGIMREIRNWEFASAQEDDCILLGDFNAAPAKMGALQSVGGVYPLISNQPTNVRDTELYDNILLEPNFTSEYTGRSGVLSLAKLFGLTIKDALRLSDHNPVWAEFSVDERGPQYQNPNQQAAARPGFSQR